MKKNFIKQLACVLTLAMVVSSVAPAATAVEAAKASSLNATAATIPVGGKFDINVKNKVKGTTYTYDYMYAAGKNYVTLNKKSGLVTAKKAGKATIKCTAKNGKTTKILKCVITVAPKATKVEISNKEGNTMIKVGSKFQFKATTTPSTASAGNVWSISDSTVFAFDKKNGYVRALKPGKATLTVTNGSVSDKVELVAAADYSAVQGGAKIIKVTSPVMLKEGDIKVTKGTSTVAIADKGIKISDDKLTAEITTAGNLVDGTYSVTLNSEKKLDFTAATEKVSKIELSSDKAALTASISSKATVGYKVANQFGEDITKKTSVQVSGSHKASGDGKGTITFDKEAPFNQNVDIVSVVVIHPESGITVQGTLTVSAAKAVSEVSVLENVYNEDGKKLTGDADLLKDDYYILFEAKDQYNGEMTEIRLKAEGNSNAEAFVTLAPGVTKLKIADESKDNVKTKKITIDGKNYAGVKLASIETKKGEEGKISAGTATLSVIGAGNGKTSNGTITVADGTEAVTLNVSPSDTVLAGNTNDFTFDATDAYGNSVTKYSALKKILFNGKNSVEINDLPDEQKAGYMYFEEDYTTGNAKLKYKAHSNITNDTQTVVQIQLTNFKLASSNFTVKAGAVPKTITKVDKDLNVMADGKKNYSEDVEIQNIKMETQYGSEISFDNMKASKYDLVVAPKADFTDPDVDIKIMDMNGNEVTKANPLVIKLEDLSSKSDKIFKVVRGGATTIKSNVEREYSISLLDANGKAVSGSELEDFKIQVVPQGKLTGYAVEDIKPIYVTSKATGTYDVKDAFARELKVTARRSGTTIVLDKSQYNITATGDLKAEDGKVYSSKNTEFKDGITEIKETVTVTINATGDPIVKDVVLTNVKPKVTSVVKDNDVNDTTAVKAAPSGDPANDCTFATDGILNAKALFATSNPFGFKVKTQYDNEATVAGGEVFYKLNNVGDKLDVTPRITFTKWTTGSTENLIPSTAKNGTKEANLTLAAGDSVMVSLDFGNGQIIKFRAVHAAK